MTLHAISSLVLFVGLTSCEDDPDDNPSFPKIVTDEIITLVLQLKKTTSEVWEIGKRDGSGSYFRASPTGTGKISAFTPAGPLSMYGDIAAHPFKDEVEWHIVGAYHMDDKTHGPNLGPDGTAVEQFAFIFKPQAQP